MNTKHEKSINSQTHFYLFTCSFFNIGNANMQGYIANKLTDTDKINLNYQTVFHFDDKRKQTEYKNFNPVIKISTTSRCKYILSMLLSFFNLARVSESLISSGRETRIFSIPCWRS